MDDFQPQYCGSGTITNLAELGEVTFENVNNFSFRVDYKTTSYNIVVRYYKDEATTENLIAEDEISLSEKDFYAIFIGTSRPHEIHRLDIINEAG